MLDVTDLIIYQNSLKLLKPIYRLADLLPRNELELRNQLLNTAKAIAPRIREGFAKRRSQNEFKRFLEMALGSSDGVITQLREIKIISFINIKNETCDALINCYKLESKRINTYIGKIIKNQNPKSEIQNLKSDI